MIDYEIRLGRADGGLSCLFIVAQWSDAAAIALGRAIKRRSDARLEVWRGDVRVHFESRQTQSRTEERIRTVYLRPSIAVRNEHPVISQITDSPQFPARLRG
jgi:hypothetical protein